MKTIQVVNVTAKKQGVKNGKTWTISEVETVEGTKYDTFDVFEAGNEYQVEVVANPNPKYNANIRKVKKDSGYATTKQAATVAAVMDKNDDKEQRISMLSCISSACNYYQQRQGDEEKVIEFSKKLFHLAMNHKTDTLPF